MASGIRFDDAMWRCDDVSLATLATEVGTPTYVYSATDIEERYHRLDAALGAYPHAIHYALKANSTLAVVRLLRQAGSLADANSGGEIEVALRAGFMPDQIVLTGVGKTEQELDRAIRLGVRTINAESAGEVDRIEALAVAQGARARVAVRINPDVDARSHPHISTGLKATKFGVALDEARELCRRIAGSATLDLAGLHVHVGSQIGTLGPVRRAVGAAVALATALRAEGMAVEEVDVGGGLGIDYGDAPVPTLEEYATALLEIVRPSSLRLVVEPGRSIVGPAGALLTRVVDVKPRGPDGWCVVADAGMTDLMRPALYGAYHRIVPLTRRQTARVHCDIVGPVCETSDTLGTAREMPRPEPGDLLAVLDVGAYGSAMASNYNRRPMPAEVLVRCAGWELARRRQTVDDMLACES
jgi:diaminopimelate decarboxylase